MARAVVTALALCRRETGQPEPTFVNSPETCDHINHWAVFDSSVDVLLTVYMKNVLEAGKLMRIDLASGGTTDLGSLPYPLTADVAYNPLDHYIYGATGPFPPQDPFYLYRIWTTNGGAPAGYASVGTVAGDDLYGVAFAPEVPEPPSLLLLGTGLVGLARWRKRRP